MPKFTSKVDGYKSRISHWICKSCSVVFTVEKPGICSACGSAGEYTYIGSKKEFNRYNELKLLERSGHIDAGSLELQPRYKIIVEQTAIFDFRYKVHGREVIEDAKTSGTDTPDSKRRRKAAEAQHNIKVDIV